MHEVAPVSRICKRRLVVKALTASPTDTLHASAGNWKSLKRLSDGTPIAADTRHLGPLANKEL